MTEESRRFLAKYLPKNAGDNVTAILDELYLLIDMEGFAPPKYHEYNDFGREAQRVYDDIYWSNKKEE